MHSQQVSIECVFSMTHLPGNCWTATDSNCIGRHLMARMHSALHLSLNSSWHSLTAQCSKPVIHTTATYWVLLEEKEQVIFSPWQGSNWKWSWSTCRTQSLCARNVGQTIPEQNTKYTLSILTWLHNVPPRPFLHTEVEDRQTNTSCCTLSNKKNTNQTYEL